MKTHLILILLLIAGGGVLGFRYYQQQLANDENNYSAIYQLIDDAEKTDADINSLTLKTRHSPNDKHTAIETLMASAQKTLEEIQALNLELINNKQTSDKVELELQKHEKNLINKQYYLNDFRDQHSTLATSLKQANLMGYRLINEITAKDPGSPAIGLVEEINNHLFQWALYGEEEQALNIDKSNQRLIDAGEQLRTPKLSIQKYLVRIATAIEQQRKTQKAVDQTLSAPIQSTLSELNVNYIALQERSNGDLEKSRLYTLGYGIASLLIALYLIIMLMRSYSKLEEKVKKRTNEISLAYNRLKESQEQLIQSEKMASLGQMVAGIAHEINTPLGYVSNNVDIIRSNLEYITEVTDFLEKIHLESKKKPHNIKTISLFLNQTLKAYRQLRRDQVVSESTQLLSDSDHGLGEIAELVKSLKDFSRIDRQAQEYYNIHQGINSTLKIASNVLRKNNVLVSTDYNDLPDIQCIPSKLHQVFLNIVTNAAQAMPKVGGKLIIRTQSAEDGVIVSFEDSGKGMSEDIKNKMFDPFYTTKPIGEGSGLGMSISYKIIESHNGTIDVDSTEGEGTTMSIFLPVMQTKEATD